MLKRLLLVVLLLCACAAQAGVKALPWGPKPQFVDANGAPMSGGSVSTFAGGSSTPQVTYTDSTGKVANSTTITLNVRGESPNEVWLTEGLLYKIVLKDSAGATVWTVDNVSGVNDSTVTTVDEWKASGLTPTYISATSFSFAGDQTVTFHANRRLKTTNSGGTIYSTISTSTFGAGITTLVVVNDSGSLDSGLSAVSYGLMASTNTSMPAFKQNSLTGATPRGFLSKSADIVSVFDFLSAAEIADVQAGTATIDIASKIQAAIDSRTTGTIYFPRGTYSIGTTISVNKGGVTLLCEAESGQSAAHNSFVGRIGLLVLMRIGDPAEASGNGAHINARVTIRNCGFTGVAASTSGLRVYNTSVKLEDVYITNVTGAGGIGLWMKKAWSSSLNRVVVQSTAGDHIRLETENNSVSIMNSSVLSDAAASGLVIKAGQNSIDVVNFDAEGMNYGIEIDTSLGTVENVNIIGSNFESNTTYGIYAHGASAVIGLRVIGTRHNGAGNGVFIDNVNGGLLDGIALNATNLNFNTAAQYIATGQIYLTGGAAITGQVDTMKAIRRSENWYEDKATVGALAYTLDASLYNTLQLNLTAATTTVTFTINNTSLRPRGEVMCVTVANTNTATVGGAVNFPAAFKLAGAASGGIPAANTATSWCFVKDANNLWREISRAVNAAANDEYYLRFGTFA